MNTRIMLHALALTALLTLPAAASDHLDTQAVIADPAGDIGDLYAWMSPDGRRLNLVMTIVGKKFLDHDRYTFHIDSGRTLGKTSATSTIECDFNSAVAPECRLDQLDVARGDASVESGVESAQKHFRVFAGLRDDPFFNNVKGTRAALNVAAAALKAGVPHDAAGCPRFDAATSKRILDEWRHTDGGPGSNFLAGWNTAALVIEVDIGAVNHGGSLLGVWATTTVRKAPPGHPPLQEGVVIDRIGRALTGNALIGTFDSAEASNARKEQYNRAPREAWPMFAPDLAENLAIYDGFDGICGNQWLAHRHADLGQYTKLAMLLADDRIWIDSRARKCEHSFGVELRRGDCGGRPPSFDAVDVFRSLLVSGKESGVEDGVSQDDHPTSDTEFPFLAPPAS
jgi:Domain of unknown function (DUF4331)